MIAHAPPSDYAARRLDEALAAIGETRALFMPNQYGNLLRSRSLTNARLRVYRLMLEPRGEMRAMSVYEIAEVCGVSHSGIFSLLKRGTGDAKPKARAAARNRPLQPDQVLDGIEAALACIADAEHLLKDSPVRSEVVRAVIHLERAMALVDREIML